MEHTLSHQHHSVSSKSAPSKAEQSVWITYKPLIIVAVFILGVAAIVEMNSTHLMPMRAMNSIMAGFFIFFSFFKLLNLSAFADAFSTYDVLAKRSRAYALTYPFIELALGLCFALGVFTQAANILTVAILGIGNYGVWLVLKRKGTIQCACLGTIFNLPMTKITLFENSAMITMALIGISGI